MGMLSMPHCSLLPPCRGAVENYRNDFWRGSQSQNAQSLWVWLDQEDCVGRWQCSTSTIWRQWGPDVTSSFDAFDEAEWISVCMEMQRRIPSPIAAILSKVWSPMKTVVITSSNSSRRFFWRLLILVPLQGWIPLWRRDGSQFLNIYLQQCASIFLISPTANFFFLPKCIISLLYHHKPDLIQSIVQDNINNAPLSASTSSLLNERMFIVFWEDDT